MKYDREYFFIENFVLLYLPFILLLPYSPSLLSPLEEESKLHLYLSYITVSIVRTDTCVNT
jgi:hypothetical protein